MQNITLEFTNEITSAGLSKDQAVVYETLLKLGEAPASAITKAIPVSASLSRPLVYKVLEELIVLDLAEKQAQEGKVAVFLPKHPTTLNKVIDDKKAAIDKVRKQFVAISGTLSSLYNLSVGKPGVQMYEGKEGVWEVLLDSLTATREILTYADLKAIDDFIPDLNAEYSTLREERGVLKRGLVIDSPQARSFLKSYDGNVTHSKLIAASEGFLPFQTIMQIYDNKVSYITLSSEHMIGMIITNQHIANTHRYLFESHWKLSSGEEI